MAIVADIIVGSDLSNLEDFPILKVQATGDSRFKKKQSTGESGNLNAPWELLNLSSHSGVRDQTPPRNLPSTSSSTVGGIATVEFRFLKSKLDIQP